MREDILNIGVSNSSKRKLKITKIHKKWVTLKGGETTEKIVMHAVDASQPKHIFKISDCYVLDRDGEPKITGLWFTLVNNEISQESSLAKTLKRYEAEVLGEMIGKTVEAAPDKKNYLVIVSCDM
jgi:hypothetical protein